MGIKTKAYVDCCKHYGGGDNAFGYLMISIRENRYCLNVAREHCSNGIYFIIDIASLTFTQRCHACKSFCSECFYITRAPFKSNSESGSCNEEERQSCEGIINRMNNRREALITPELLNSDACSTVNVARKKAPPTTSPQAPYTADENPSKVKCAKYGESTRFGLQRTDNSPSFPILLERKRAPPTCSLGSLSQNGEKEQTMKPSLAEVTSTKDNSLKRARPFSSLTSLIIGKKQKVNIFSAQAPASVGNSQSNSKSSQDRESTTTYLQEKDIDISEEYNQDI